MTEYDYSPEAYERYVATQTRIAKWVNQTEKCAPQFSNPFVPSERGASPPHTHGREYAERDRRFQLSPSTQANSNQRLDLRQRQHSGSWDSRGTYIPPPPRGHTPYPNLHQQPPDLPTQEMYTSHSKMIQPNKDSQSRHPHLHRHHHEYGLDDRQTHSHSSYHSRGHHSRGHHSNPRHSDHSHGSSTRDDNDGSPSYSNVRPYQVDSPVQPSVAPRPYQKSYSSPPQMLLSPQAQINPGRPYIVVPRSTAYEPHYDSTAERYTNYPYIEAPHEPLLKRIIHGIANGMHNEGGNYKGHHGRRRERTRNH